MLKPTRTLLRKLEKGDWKLRWQTEPQGISITLSGSDFTYAASWGRPTSEIVKVIVTSLGDYQVWIGAFVIDYTEDTQVSALVKAQRVKDKELVRKVYAVAKQTVIDSYTTFVEKLG